MNKRKLYSVIVLAVGSLALAGCGTATTDLASPTGPPVVAQATAAPTFILPTAESTAIPPTTEPTIISPTTETQASTSPATSSGDPSPFLWNEVRAIQFSPDSTLIAANAKNKVAIVDVATQDIFHILVFEPLEEYSSVESMAFSADGKLLALSNGQQATQLWDVASGTLLKQIGTTGQVAFSPDNQFLAIVHTERFDNEAELHPSWQSMISLWKVGNGELVRQFKRQSDDIASFVSFSPDGTVLAVAGSSNVFSSLDTWDAQNGELLGQRKEIDGFPSCLVPLAEGQQFVLGLRGKASEIVGNDASLVRELRQTVNSATCSSTALADFDASSKIIRFLPIANSAENSINLNDYIEAIAPDSVLKTIAISPNNRWIVIADHRLLFWDVNAGSLSTVIEPM